MKQIDELLKAIRASQRNIALVCFIGLASLWGFEGNLVEEARHELTDLQAVVAVWEREATWLADWAEKQPEVIEATSVTAPMRILAAFQDHGQSFPKRDPTLFNPDLRVSLSKPWTVYPLPPMLHELNTRNRTGRDRHMFSRNSANHWKNPNFDAPTSIDEFALFWNELGTIKLQWFDDPVTQMRGISSSLREYLDEDEGSTFFQERIRPPANKPPEDDVVEVNAILVGFSENESGIAKIECPSMLWCDNDGNLIPSAAIVVEPSEGYHAHLAITAKTSFKALSARSAFRSHYSKRVADATSWDDTTFEYTFPALYQFSKNGLEHLSLADLSSVLDNEIARNQTALSIFGASIPLGRIGFWVCLLVLSLQCFFWAQLTQLEWHSQREGFRFDEITEPWAGFFDGIGGSLSVIVLTCVLPFCVCVLLAYNVTSRGSADIGSAIYFAITVVSLILANKTLVLRGCAKPLVQDKSP